ncbi:MAG: L-2-amino-thiazoline-4-carboxylic acid hydrolase [Deltaproteobacteria bacterium]|nr:L-2-amino-thiazoline-4-carboxylic acid hydrolase [Deltaproteobacteria bacterium]
MDLATDLAVKRAAIRGLAREVGRGRALLWLGRSQLTRDPLRGLPPADTAAERDTRAQLGPALRVYRFLRGRVGEEEALRLTRAIVVAAGEAFLERRTAGLEPGRWRALNEQERRALLEQVGAGFPNARLEVERVEADRIAFGITACRFVELCAELGVPELSPVFCAADDAFFGRGPVRLERPTLLSTGGARCAFELSLPQAEEGEAGSPGEGWK